MSEEVPNQDTPLTEYMQPWNGERLTPRSAPPTVPPRTDYNDKRAGYIALGCIGVIIVLLIACTTGYAIAFPATHAAPAAQVNPHQLGPVVTTHIPPKASTPRPTSTPAPTAPPAPTATDTPTPQWTTVYTFSGNGSKQTIIFPMFVDSWQLVWSCDPSSSYGGQYNVIVNLKNSDGTDADYAAVNTICQSGYTGDMTTEYIQGDFYLQVLSEGYWQVQVQVLQ